MRSTVPQPSASPLSCQASAVGTASPGVKCIHGYNEHRSCPFQDCFMLWRWHAGPLHWHMLLPNNAFRQQVRVIAAACMWHHRQPGTASSLLVQEYRKRKAPAELIPAPTSGKLWARATAMPVRARAAVFDCNFQEHLGNPSADSPLRFLPDKSHCNRRYTARS